MGIFLKCNFYNFRNNEDSVMMIDSDSDEDDDDDDEDREDEDDDDSDGYEPGMLAVGKFFVVVVFCVVVSSVFNLLKIVIVCNSVAELEPIF